MINIYEKEEGEGRNYNGRKEKGQEGRKATKLTKKQKLRMKSLLF